MPAAEAATTQPTIRKLPALLVNQIAAGEVVERPASVVKELVENSLDAGATRITIDLEQGGIELIRTSDDGRGISSDQLPLALAPHATSKISRAEDLDRITTMGFRGEALASIASVSRLSIRSRAAGVEGASQLDVEGDVAGPVRPAAGPLGTSVTVRNLFFNTPARRKFLRTPVTEQGHCLDVVHQLAMSHPAIGFTATCDGRTVFDVSPSQSPRERALAVLGRELAEQLLDVNADHFDDARGLALWGLAGLPALAKANAKHQYLFLNGRAIRDRTIQHALREAYRGLIEPGRYPTAAIMIEMDPGAVDVNVHPQKAEVRFRDQSMVHGVVLRAVREALRAADLTPRIGGWHGGSGGGMHVGAGAGWSDHDSALPASGNVAPVSADERRSLSSFVDFFRRPMAGAVGSAATGRLSFDVLRQTINEADSTPQEFAPSSATDSHTASAGPAQPPASMVEPTSPPPIDPASLLHAPRPADRLLQVHNSYIATQDEQGLLIIDQHALHERVMFEALLERIGAGNLESQRMLVPPVLNVPERQIGRLSELAPLLSRIGVVLEPIGPGALAVHAFPTFLFDRGVDPVEFIAELLERAEAEDFAPGSEQALHEVLDMMSCKAAVKAGDRMSDPELHELLRLRGIVERSSNCPHGRPTSIRLTIHELEKRFGRT